MGARERIDAALVRRGLVDSVAQAERLVRSGKVLVNDQCVDKPGTQISKEASVRLRGDLPAFVSRGGLKLKGALDDFELRVEGLRCLDVGIGTGGFTDCLLQAGASHVTGVDVGYGDVAWRIRNDPRVQLFERTNFRTLDVAELGPAFDLAVVDCSFISLELLLPNLASVVVPGGELVTLIKPQFEASQNQILEGGLVTDAEVRDQVRLRIEEVAQSHGFTPIRAVDSTVPGARSGNVEWFVRFHLKAGSTQ